MNFLRRAALWIGCAVLLVTFVTVEQLADSTMQLIARRPIEVVRPETGALAPPTRVAAQVMVREEAPEAETPFATAPRAERAAEIAVAAADGEKVYRICRVTAYCDRGTTAAGIPSGMGQCAAPGDIPFGTRVHIPALNKTFIVTDRTHKRFRNNTVDLFIPSKSSCKAFGRHYLECVFTLPDEPARYGQVRVPRGLR